MYYYNIVVYHIAIEEMRDKLFSELNDEAQIKLGDASIASPFTCKSTGIDKGRSCCYL